jgi:hypothetical protein
VFTGASILFSLVIAVGVIAFIFAIWEIQRERGCFRAGQKGSFWPVLVTTVVCLGLLTWLGTLSGVLLNLFGLALGLFYVYGGMKPAWMNWRGLKP